MAGTRRCAFVLEISVSHVDLGSDLVRADSIDSEAHTSIAPRSQSTTTGVTTMPVLGAAYASIDSLFKKLLAYVGFFHQNPRRKLYRTALLGFHPTSTHSVLYNSRSRDFETGPRRSEHSRASPSRIRKRQPSGEHLRTPLLHRRTTGARDPTQRTAREGFAMGLFDPVLRCAFAPDGPWASDLRSLGDGRLHLS